MNRLLLFSLYFSTLSLVAQVPSIGTAGPQLQWSKEFGINGQLDEAANVLTDSQGNIVIVGLIGDLPGKVSLAKYSPAGSLMWQTTYTVPDGSSLSENLRVGTDAVGNFYIASTYTRSFGPGFFLVKYSSGGTRLWEKVETANSDHRSMRQMKVDAAGNCYAGFYIAGHSGGVSSDYLLKKYDAQGSKLWHYIYEGTDYVSHLRDLDIDAAGNCYLMGSQSYQTSNGVRDRILTVKVTSNGSLGWARTYAFSTRVWHDPESIKVDNNGNIFVITTCSNYVNGRDTLLTLKYGPSGTFMWSNLQMAGSYTWYPGVPGNDGSFYLATTASNSRVRVIKCNAAGQTAWTAYYPGSLGANRPVSMKLDGAGSVYVTGYNDEKIFAVKFSPSGERKWSFQTLGNTGATRSQGRYLALYPATSSTPLVYLFGHSMVPGEYSDDPGNLLLLKYTQPITPTIGLSSTLNPTTNVPTNFEFGSCPNPFRNQLTLDYHLPERSHVILEVSDISGKLISRLVNANQDGGEFRVGFDGSHLPAQPLVFTIRIKSSTHNYMQTKMVVLKK